MNIYKKAKLPNNIYKNNNYSKTTYSGFSKILYKINHKLLDFKVDEKYNEHIVDVGGGAEQHLKYMNIKNIKTYTIIDSKIFRNEINKLQKKFKNIKIYFIDYKKIKYIKKKKLYTRMVSSHTFEHFDDFEQNFLNLMPLMQLDSLISVALPCDPGLTWRFLQFFSYFNQKKTYGWKNLKQKDLDDSRDHLTSAQNILKILRYYFLNIKNIYFPFLLPIIEINIFLIMQIKTRLFKK